MKQRPLHESNGRWSKKSVGGWYAEGAPPEPDPEPPAIEIDGKKITADDYRAIQSEFTKKAQALSVVETAAQKYGMTPAEYIEQAEGAFGVASALISDGIIDGEGNILVKKDQPTGDQPPADPPKPQPAARNTDMEKRIETIEKALSGIGNIGESLGAIKEDQNRLLRLDLQRQLQAKHPIFTEDDVSRVLATAMNNRTKDLWAHAIDYETGKKEKDVEQRKKYAEEYGLNYEELEAKRRRRLNPNNLKESGPEGGAGALFKNKKFSFKGKGKDSVKPLDAMEEYLRAAREE